MRYRWDVVVTVAGAIVAVLGVASPTGEDSPIISEDFRFLDPAPERGDRLGRAVALHTDTAVIAKPGHDVPDRIEETVTEDVGAVYILNSERLRPRGEWAPRQLLVPSDAHDSMFFGEQLALDGATLLVGKDSNLTGNTV